MTIFCGFSTALSELRNHWNLFKTQYNRTNLKPEIVSSPRLSLKPSYAIFFAIFRHHFPASPLLLLHVQEQLGQSIKVMNSLQVGQTSSCIKQHSEETEKQRKMSLFS